MNKQFSILAATLITAALFSCSKEKIETQQGAISEETTAKKGGGAGSGGGNPSVNLDKGLEGLYRFDANLAEATGKLKDGFSTTAGADIYTDDRNGNPNSAIQFTGRYGVDIFDIPVEMNFTVAAWVKYETGFAPFPTSHFISSNLISPGMAQEMNEVAGVISTPMTTSVHSVVDDHWHHLTATYDGKDLKFYVDGNYIGKSTNPASGVYPPGSTVNYKIGYFGPVNSSTILSTWKGNMDDLRFYTRVLSAAEVQAVYNF